MFATIPKVAFDATGNLYVFDRAPGSGSPDLRILIYDRAGTFVREFGSVGDGPGEFRQLRSYGVFRDGTVVVGDIGHTAYQLFDRTSEFLRMVHMDRTETIRRVSDLPHCPGDHDGGRAGSVVLKDRLAVPNPRPGDIAGCA